MVGGKKVTITTGSKDRLEHLMRALPTWLALREADSIIIVDWGSKIPLYEALADFKDSRLHIVRVSDEPFWCNAKCHNLELRMAGNDGLLLRLDNDALVSRDFLAKHPFIENAFYAVDWRQVLPYDDDKRNLAGTLLVETARLWEVNGYNERLIHYGREDDELYDRLVKHGLTWNMCDLTTLDHQPHDDESRMNNLQITPTLDKLAGGRSPRARKEALIALSTRIAKDRPWTLDDAMTEWWISPAGERYFLARKDLGDLHV
jgi:hypothetical protein